MVTQQKIEKYVSGTHNLLPNETIPKDAASSSQSWLTKDGHIELIYGRQTVGGAGLAGKNYAEHTGYKVNGTAVRFRKVNSTIQYLNGSTWTTVISGLTSTADYTFANYQSLAGAFVYCFGVDGIYKICTANPGDYALCYEAAKNFKGYGLIDKARTILWGRAEDPTGLYGSYIDAQNSSVYTTVSGEATTSGGGTLAFKAGGSRRTCFGVALTLGSETYTDNGSGVLTGSLGGTGTINYMTGVYTVSNTTVGTASYQWEDSNNKGVTDFTKSSTRLAGEGFVIRQDAGGSPIKTVIPINGEYYSMKSNLAYLFSLDSTDLNPTNQIYRTDIGVPTLRSAVGTGQGIVFLNTANPSKPVLTVLQQNPQGDNLLPVVLFDHFAFENYQYDDMCVDTWDSYIVIGCKKSSGENNILLLCDQLRNTVDETYYGIRTTTKANGYLYGGDPVSQTTYEMFTGFDDNGIKIQNYWIGNGETYGSDVLKRVKKLRFKGWITPAQYLQVYVAVDSGDFQLVGTIRGNGDYVDYGTTYALGTSLIGVPPIGGGTAVTASPYFMEMKIKLPKFRKRQIKFVAMGYGYVSVEQATDFDIWTYQEKMPSKYRLKQNVSLDGLTTNLPNPEF